MCVEVLYTVNRMLLVLKISGRADDPNTTPCITHTTAPLTLKHVRASQLLLLGSGSCYMWSFQDSSKFNKQYVSSRNNTHENLTLRPLIAATMREQFQYTSQHVEVVVVVVEVMVVIYWCYLLQY